MKTIKQIADELGVSKQAVQKRMSREPLYTSLYPCLQTKNGTKYIDETGESIVKAAFDKNAPTIMYTEVADNQQPNVHSDIIKILQDNITVLQQQLEVKDNLIVTLSKQNQALTDALENTTSSLKAAQALHAGTIKQQAMLEAPPAEASDETDKPGFFDRLRQAFK